MVSSPVRKSFSLTTLLGFLGLQEPRGLQSDILTVTMGARNAIDRYLELRAGIVSHRPQSSSPRASPSRHRLLRIFGGAQVNNRLNALSVAPKDTARCGFHCAIVRAATFRLEGSGASFHRTSRVHHVRRRRGGGVAARGALRRSQSRPSEE